MFFRLSMVFPLSLNCGIAERSLELFLLTVQLKSDRQIARVTEPLSKFSMIIIDYLLLFNYSRNCVRVTLYIIPYKGIMLKCKKITCCHCCEVLRVWKSFSAM